MDAAWHPDPGGRHELRYWDGSSWTDHVSDNGVTSLDPLPPYPGEAVQESGQESGQPAQESGQGAAYESQDSPVVDLSTEPTRFAPGAALPTYDQHDQHDQAASAPAQDEPTPYEPWAPQAAETPADAPAPYGATDDRHEAQTLPPSSEPIFASMGESKPDLEPEPAAEPEPTPEPEPAPEPEPTTDPDAWVRGLLADGEQLVDSLAGDEREVTVTSHRVIVREHAGGWAALRLDRVSHVEVTGDGTGREAVLVHVTGGPDYRVTGDTEQVASLVRALTT